MLTEPSNSASTLNCGSLVVVGNAIRGSFFRMIFNTGARAVCASLRCFSDR